MHIQVHFNVVQLLCNKICWKNNFGHDIWAFRPKLEFFYWVLFIFAYCLCIFYRHSFLLSNTRTFAWIKFWECRWWKLSFAGINFCEWWCREISWVEIFANVKISENSIFVYSTSQSSRQLLILIKNEKVSIINRVNCGEWSRTNETTLTPPCSGHPI